MNEIKWKIKDAEELLNSGWSINDDGRWCYKKLRNEVVLSKDWNQIHSQYAGRIFPDRECLDNGKGDLIINLKYCWGKEMLIKIED